MKHKPLNPARAKHHSGTKNNHPLSGAQGWRHVGPSLFLHTASRLLVSTTNTTARALNPLKCPKNILLPKLFDEYHWLTENLKLLSAGYQGLLDLSTNFTVIKQPDFDFTRVVPITKIQICSHCKRFATGSQQQASKQDIRRGEHYKESPQCRGSPLISCQGVATTQHPVTFLVFCDRRTEKLMVSGQNFQAKEERKLKELKELLGVVDITANEATKETKTISPRRLRRMSDVSDTVQAEKRTNPKRKLRRLSEIEKEVVDLADPDHEDTVAGSSSNDDAIVEEDEDEIFKEEDAIAVAEELLEDQKVGPIDDPESPPQEVPTSDTVEEIKSESETNPQPPIQQSFAEFIFTAVNSRMGELAEAITSTKKTIKYPDLYKLIDPDPSVAQRRLAPLLLEFLKSELMSRQDVAHLIYTHMRPTPLELIISDSQQTVCMSIQITRVIGRGDLVFTVRIKVFLDYVPNPFIPNANAQTFESKDMGLIEVCSMMEVLQMVTAAVLTQIGIGYGVTGYDLRDVVDLCVGNVGLKDQASCSLFQRYLKSKRAW